jgi:glycosyltransferase involved in cell wall biosynthesis
VLDVRGAWPLELVFHRIQDEPERAEAGLRREYDQALAALRAAVRDSDGVTTVSEPLRRWLIASCGAGAEVSVVPCCVKSTTGDERREDVRRGWGAGAGPVLVYSGTVKSYQHVEDLVLPFAAAFLGRDAAARVVLLTPDIEAMRRAVQAAGLAGERVVVASLPQAEVRFALTGGDAGLLLRAPSALNRLSQPTKLGEYLAAGLPVVVEAGTGEVPEIVERAGAGIAVRTARAPAIEVAAQAARVLDWTRQHGPAARTAARRLAESDFTWARALPTLRSLYSRALVAARNRSTRGLSRSAS